MNRRSFIRSASSFTSIVVIAASASAAAPPTPATIATADITRIDPIAIAPIGANGVVGEWRPYIETALGGCYGSGFDSFEAIRSAERDQCRRGVGNLTDGVRAGGFGEFCDPLNTGEYCGPVARWVRGPDFIHAGRRSSGLTATRNMGGTICRLQLAWRNEENAGELDPLGRIVGDTIVAVRVFGGMFDQTCGGEEPGLLGGVALDFGPSVRGSYYVNVDLDEFDIPLPRGAHGNEVYFYFDEQMSAPAANSQVLLWGAKDEEYQGVNAPIIYEDRNFDGEFDPLSECFDSSWANCPSPASTMIAFYLAGEGQCQSFDVSRLVAGAPATFTVESASNVGQPYGVFWFLDHDQALRIKDCLFGAPGNEPRDLARCFVENGADPRRSFACGGRLDGTGLGECSVLVPPGASGQGVTFLAVVQGVDGSFCIERVSRAIE